MEHYKQQEIKHYDSLAKNWQQSHDEHKWDSDAEYLAHGNFSSYQFVDSWLKTHTKEGLTLLDYGCGNGIHSILPAKLGAKVIGIDLSKESLAIARQRAKREGVQARTEFLQIDCENLSFKNGSFDIVLDGGSFSSLDINKAIPEIARVLKPSGTLIAIETFGHNPLTNLKRSINKILGKRTGWAVDHIAKIDDITLIKNYFGDVQMFYFHFFSLFAFPFLSFRVGKVMLRLLEYIDHIILGIPFLQKYAFKIVIIASNPIFTYGKTAF